MLELLRASDGGAVRRAELGRCKQASHKTAVCSRIHWSHRWACSRDSLSKLLRCSCRPMRLVRGPSCHPAKRINSHSVSYRCTAVEPKKVCTGPALQRLENVKNIRDLAEACSAIKPGDPNHPQASACNISEVCPTTGGLIKSNTVLAAGMVLRSGCPNSASASDILVLRDELNVQQLVRSACQPSAFCMAQLCDGRPSELGERQLLLDLFQPRTTDDASAAVGATAVWVAMWRTVCCRWTCGRQ